MKNYKMHWQSSSNPFLTLMMMVNIETKFVCAPFGNEFCLSYWLQKAIGYDTGEAFHRLQTRWIFWFNVISLKHLRNVRVGIWLRAWNFEGEMFFNFSVVISQKNNASINYVFECWYLFKQIQKYIWNDLFRQILLNFTTSQW